MTDANQTKEGLIDCNKRKPCPICGRTTWCSYNSFLICCKKEPEGAYKVGYAKTGHLFYMHRRNTNAVHAKTELIRPSAEMVEAAPINKRDKVYKAFLGLLDLSAQHKKDLIKRGLSVSDIIKNNYKSCPANQKPWEICKTLIDVGLDLHSIPGFYTRESKFGTGSYWTFDNIKGCYFIPVMDAQGRIQALQRRLTNPGEDSKYKIFSSSWRNEGSCSSTPAHMARPAEIKDECVWVTEGPLKSDISAKYLDAIVIGALSAGSWVPALEMLKEIKDRKIVLAYDMDFKTNQSVRDALGKFKETLIKEGFLVYQATWEKAKGIDDALVFGMPINIKKV